MSYKDLFKKEKVSVFPYISQWAKIMSSDHWNDTENLIKSLKQSNPRSLACVNLFPVTDFVMIVHIEEHFIYVLCRLFSHSKNFM